MTSPSRKLLQEINNSIIAADEDAEPRVYFSGIELIDHVRNELQLSSPIIIISSAGNEDNVLSAFELGANDFIAKPVSPSELLVRVGRELQKNSV